MLEQSNVLTLSKASKVIVTGSAGFLGKHLVRRLTFAGYDVIGWDIVEGNDVCDPNLKSTDIDAIYHLASPVDPGHYEKIAVDVGRTNFLGTLNMLNLAKENKAKFLFTSSSEVYGDMGSRPFKETDVGKVDVSDQRAYYSEAKRAGEMLTLLYHNLYSLDVRIVRPFNIYGPGMRKNDSRVIPSFIREIQRDKPIIIYGLGQATRTFCYVDDFIEGMMRAMYYPNTNGETFNLGTTEEISISELAQLFGNQIEYKESRKDEPAHRRPNISKAKKILKWEPMIKLRKGLELTWAHYR